MCLSHSGAVRLAFTDGYKILRDMEFTGGVFFFTRELDSCERFECRVIDLKSSDAISFRST